MDSKKIGLMLMTVLFCSLGQAQNSIQIPAGEFKMPAKLNQKSLKVTSFRMDVYPVTNQEYLEFVRQNPQWQKSKVKKIFADKSYLDYWKTDLNFGENSLGSSPVVRVSWFAAREYCSWKGKRLPQTVEWEYAALSPYKNKTEIRDLILEWYGKGAEWPLPHVGKRNANVMGVHDMHGLIWEWVEDFNTSLVTGESRADGGLDKNLFCGGGAAGAADPGDYAAFMRYAFRSSLQARYTVQNLGFRCVQ